MLHFWQLFHNVYFAFRTGGGFSDYFTRPTWQEKAVHVIKNNEMLILLICLSLAKKDRLIIHSSGILKEINIIATITVSKPVAIVTVGIMIIRKLNVRIRPKTLGAFIIEDIKKGVRQ